MIAACPKCGARYRVDRDRLAAGGVRLRCARCEAVFRVRAPQPAPAKPAASRDASITPEEVSAPPAPSSAPASRGSAGPLVLVAMPDDALAGSVAEALGVAGLSVMRVRDGVEAMLEVQRKLPRALVLAADLPKMFGFQVCEVVKRNESLRDTWVVLVGAIHHRDRYRRAPEEIYGADVYVESTELPAGLLPALARGGVIGTPSEAGGAGSPPEPGAQRAKPAAWKLGSREANPTAAKVESPAAKVEALEGDPTAAKVGRPAQEPTQPRAEAALPSAGAAKPEVALAEPPVQEPTSPPVAAANESADDGLSAERAKAERLARIVVSDIVLYNEARFSAAARGGDVVAAMAADLAEGRQLFAERIDPRVREERDHLADELRRRAAAQGAA